MGHPRRLSGHDYSSPGYYFVTLKTYRVRKLFGVIEDDSIRLTAFGEIVRKEWLRTGDIRSGVVVDEFVVMPDHFHGILQLRPDMNSSRNPTYDSFNSPPSRQILTCPPGSLGAIIRGFKGACTYQINQLRNTRGQPVWQNSFFDHVIKTPKALNQIRYYIKNNPRRLLRSRQSKVRPNFNSAGSGKRDPRRAEL